MKKKKEASSDEQLPPINWKNVRWERPMLLADDVESITRILDSGDYDPTLIVENWIMLHYHFKISKYEKQMFHCTLVFWLPRGHSGDWVGTSAAASQLGHAIVVLREKCNIIRDNTHDDTTLPNGYDFN